MQQVSLPESSPVLPSEDARTIMVYRVSWAAVFAGVAVSLVIQLLLSMLGLGIGIATIDPGTADNPDPGTFSLAAALWWVASGIVAAGVGGMAAGRLSGRPSLVTAGLHGLVAWAATTLVVVYMMTAALGGILGGAFSMVQSGAAGIGDVAGEAARRGTDALVSQYAEASDPWRAIERDVRDASGGNDPAALRDAAVSAVQALVTGDPAKTEEARERAAQAISRAQSIPVEEARQRVGEYESQYRQAAEKAKAEATRAAEVATKAVSRGALMAFLALVLGAVAAWFGGRAGKVEPIVTDDGMVSVTEYR